MTIENVDDANFEEVVLKSGKPVIVDYWAEWCGPCKMIAPILEQVDKEIGEQVKIVKVNIDENPQAPAKYGIRSIPTLMLFKDGQNIDARIGGINKTQLLGWLSEHTQ